MVNVLPLAANFNTFLIVASVFPTCCILCTFQSKDTNTRKLKFMDFWWSQWCNLVKFGHNLNQSWSCNLVFRETIHDSHSQHFMIMPAQCSWHYIGYELSDITSKSFSLRKSSAFNSGSIVSKLWVVLANSKCRACCWPAMVVAKFWGLWRNYAGTVCCG